MSNFKSEDSLGALPEAEQQAYVDLLNHKDMPSQDVKDWIDYYMDGGELPDDIQQQVLSMALKYAEQNET